MSDFAISFFGVMGWLIGQMSWVHALLFAMILYFVLALRHAHCADDNHFSLADALTDSRTGKASLDNIILLGMAIMAAWVVVDRSNSGREVESLLVLVLGVFVAGREVRRGINAWKPPPPPEGAPDFQRTTTETQTQITKGKPKE